MGPCPRGSGQGWGLLLAGSAGTCWAAAVGFKGVAHPSSRRPARPAWRCSEPGARARCDYRSCRRLRQALPCPSHLLPAPARARLASAFRPFGHHARCHAACSRRISWHLLHPQLPLAWQGAHWADAGDLCLLLRRQQQPLRSAHVSGT